MGYRQDNLAKMEQRKKHKREAGLVSERFPGISSIVIKMQHFHIMSSEKGINPILMERTINLLPGGSADLSFKCMVKECENGGFDLTRTIKSMVKGRKKTMKGELVCRGRHPDLPTDHAHISYEIIVDYKKTAK